MKSVSLHKYADDFAARRTFLVVTFVVLISEVSEERIINSGSVWQEKCRARGEFVEHEELLLSAKLPVISLGCLLEEFLVLSHLLLVWE